MSQPDHVPSIKDVGLSTDILARWACLGIVFEKMETPEAPMQDVPEEIVPSHHYAVLRVTSGLGQLFKDHSEGIIDKVLFDRTIEDSMNLEPDQFKAQYPEYGPY